MLDMIHSRGMKTNRFETYSKLWAVTVVNGDDTFTTNAWRDTAAGAERQVKALYPEARVFAEYVGGVQ